MLSSDIAKTKGLIANNTLNEAIEKSQLLDHLKYTCLHRRIIKGLAIKLGINPTKYAYHDCDKMVMMLFRTDEEVNKYHRSTQPHHDTNTSDEEVLTEMMLDWESARFTKPDKPLNALGTLQKWYPDMTDRMLPVLKKYNMGDEVISDAISQEDYEKLVATITAQKIADDIIRYVEGR